MKRRTLFLSGGAALAVIAGGGAWLWAQQTTRPEGDFEVSLSEAEWRERLTEQEFAVLREAATEAPYTSDLLDEDRDGIFTCAGCGQDLYSSDTKYDSQTGWPSFWDVLDGAIGTQADYALVVPRTECHCSRCGGHLGHIFEDGPDPTGLRHCINGAALDFRPETA